MHAAINSYSFRPRHTRRAPCATWLGLLLLTSVNAAEPRGWLCTHPLPAADAKPKATANNPRTASPAKPLLRLQLPEFKSAWDVVHHQAHLGVLLTGLQQESAKALQTLHSSGTDSAFLQVSTGDKGLLTLQTLASVHALPSPAAGADAGKQGKPAKAIDKKPFQLCVPVMLAIPLSRDGEGNQLLGLPPEHGTTLHFSNADSAAFRGFLAAVKRAQIKTSLPEPGSEGKSLICTLNTDTVRCKAPNTQTSGR